MMKLIALIAVVIALFIFLPTTPAAVWSIVPLLLVFGLMFDAYRRGKRILARQRMKEDTLVETTRMIGYVAIFHVLWVGLHGNDAQAGAGGDYAGGADIGGFDGGFDGGGGGGGGDAGGGGF